MNTELRHYCRNTHCRSKLKTPVENEHHAFCCRGCHAVFYRNRCQVCEEPKQRKTDVVCEEPTRRRTGLTCLNRKCKSERRRFPDAYSWPEYKTNETAGFLAPNDGRRTTLAKTLSPPSETPNLRASKPASFGTERPYHHCLRMWSWGGDGVADHSLYDIDGLTIARIVLDGDRYVLRCPNAWPRQSWPNLARAKRGAESFAPMNLPLDPVTAARVARDNAKPHPMAVPPDAQVVEHTEVPFEAPLIDADPWALPDFLRRA